jgi:hypothetical protein
MENNNRQGCRWTKASERLPENNVKAFWRKQINHDYYVGYDYFNDSRFMELDKIEWLDESPIEPCATSSRIEELEKENERLKLLLEKEVKDYYAIVFPLADKERRNNKWKQYQTENNL